jgi:hypothetical protein
MQTANDSEQAAIRIGLGRDIGTSYADAGSALVHGRAGRFTPKQRAAGLALYGDRQEYRQQPSEFDAAIVSA